MMKSDFQITQDGVLATASRPGCIVTVVGGKLVHRRTIKPFQTGSAIQSSVLLGTLGGVYVYVGDEGNIVITEDGTLS